MDRRDSLRILAWGALSTGVLAEACKPSDKKQTIQSMQQMVILLQRLIEWRKKQLHTIK